MINFAVVLATFITVTFAITPDGGLPPPRPVRSPSLSASAGESCSTSGTRGAPPTPCDSPGTCVLTDFGYPAVDIPNAGICRRVWKWTPKCSVKFCTEKGAYGVCKVSGEFAFCSAWAARRDNGPAPECPEFCTKECLVKKLRASDGSTYCNACELMVASCHAGFSFFGPVSAPEKCFREFLGFDGMECCVKYNVGCIAPGGRCTTSGAFIPPIPCIPSATCVVTDFGFPAVDLPTSGHCRWVYRVPKCTLRRCVRSGAATICKVDGVVATCGAWGSRTDFGSKPECPEFCTEECLVERKRLVGSDGVFYCNKCKLTVASCESAFSIYGPVKK